MKKLILIVLMYLLVSCVTYSPIVNFIDYSYYNDQGMFLTESNSVNFDYEPIGSVNVRIYSVSEVIETRSESKSEKSIDDVYYSNSSRKLIFKNASIEQAINIAVGKAQQQGANGIINLKCEYIPTIRNIPDGWYVSGMAIKKIK